MSDREIEEIKIDQVIVYNDGSMTFLMNFPEEYGIDNSDYELERVDEIDYIEYYNEDGTKTIVDYPTPAPTERGTDRMLPNFPADLRA